MRSLKHLGPTLVHGVVSSLFIRNQTIVQIKSIDACNQLQNRGSCTSDAAKTELCQRNIMIQVNLNKPYEFLSGFFLRVEMFI